MKNSKLIYFAIALVAIALIIGWLLFGNQTTPVCETMNQLYCESDADCICTETQGCFLGNKDYYGKCADKTGICFDFCTGWGQPPVKCINNKCSNSYKLEEVTIATDKAEYEQGEAVKITAGNGLDTPVFYYGGERFWGIERFENNAWINVSGFQLTSLEDGKEVCYIKFYERMGPSELKPGSEISHEWNQKICPFDVGKQQPFEPEFIGAGRYRLLFYYGLGKSSEDPYEIDSPKTVYSSEFTIKGSIAKNCDEYEGLMTEEERANCTCPPGQQKFGCLINAYCATNSQKTCSSQADCPSGEHCISHDGNTWFCTGQLCGCYHNDPQNPTVEMCVD